MESALKAPGWSESCRTRMPNSRARRASRRISHPGSFLDTGERFGADLDEGRPADGVAILPGSDSPKIMERMASSIPIKSRMTLLVTHCQNDSCVVTARSESFPKPSLLRDLTTEFSLVLA